MISDRPPTSLPQQDIHLLTLSTLIDAKIITIPREEIERAAQASTPQERRIPGGQYLLPPWCVWPLPASTDQKAASRKDQCLAAPPVRFLGVPARALAAAGISGSQEEAEARATDPEWTYEAMRTIRNAGGFIFGGLWATARFPFHSGVDTSDLQRLLEWAMDQLSMCSADQLKAYLLGEKKPLLEISSQRKARDLVVDLDTDPKSTNSAWNRLAHPTFYTFTRSHQGPITSESIGEIRVFDVITEHFLREAGVDRRKLGKALAASFEVSRVAVALAVGQAARMSYVIADSEQKAFNSQGVRILSDWLWSLKDRERRLARHLILSPGDENSYAYLREHIYSAGVLGFRFVDDRRHRHRALQDLLKAAERVGKALEELPLPGVCAHLRKAILSIGVELTQQKSCDANLPESETPPGIWDTSRNLGHQPPETQDTNLPESGTLTSRNLGHLPKSETPPEICDAPPEIWDTNLPESGTLIQEMPCVTSSFPFSISSSFSVSFPIVSQSVRQSITQAPIEGDCKNERTNRQTDVVLQDDETKANLASPQQKEPQLVQRVRPLESWGPEASELASWMAGSDSAPWPQQLVDHLTTLVKPGLLDPTQIPKIRKDSPWTAEGAWAIMQGIQAQLRQAKPGYFKKPGGMYFNALTLPGKAASYLQSTGLLLRDCGWLSEATDGTGQEPIHRKALSTRLLQAGIQRLPLDPEQARKHREILDQERRIEEERRSAPTMLLPDFDFQEEAEITKIEDVDGHDRDQILKALSSLMEARAQNLDIDSAMTDLEELLEALAPLELPRVDGGRQFFRPMESLGQGHVRGLEVAYQEELLGMGFGAGPLCTPMNLPQPLQAEIAGLADLFRDFSAQHSEMVRQALRGNGKSTDVLGSPDYLDLAQKLKAVYLNCEKKLSSWTGRIKLSGTDQIIVCGPNAQLGEGAVRALLKELQPSRV